MKMILILWLWKLFMFTEANANAKEAKNNFDFQTWIPMASLNYSTDLNEICMTHLEVFRAKIASPRIEPHGIWAVKSK